MYPSLFLSLFSCNICHIPWAQGASQMVLVLKNLSANAGDIRDAGSIPGSGRSSEGGNGNPLHYSCLENPMDRGAWRATVHRVIRSQTWMKWLSTALLSMEIWCTHGIWDFSKSQSEYKVGVLHPWLNKQGYWQPWEASHLKLNLLQMQKESILRNPDDWRWLKNSIR